MLYAGLQLHPLRALALGLGLALLSACAAPFDAQRDWPADLPTRAAVDGVPLIQQADFYCGPASLAMVMQWAGRDITQDDVAALAFSPGAGGTYLADMVGSARRLGFVAVQLRGIDALLAEVSAGHPVIVFQNLGLGIAPVWHYGVVTAYDLQADQVTLHSGQRETMVLPVAAFARTWARGDDWAIVVLPPDQLPATVGSSTMLRAVAALERSNPAAAEIAYDTGAGRWGEDWLWPFGLANARYAQGDLQGARRALLAAQAIAPDIPEIRANLATVTKDIAAR